MIPASIRPVAAASFFLLLAPGPRANAQGWDYGRNMFGFAQHYPGSGWSSYYHPGFDPDAWYPGSFGLVAGHDPHGQPTAAVYGPRPVPPAGSVGDFYSTYRGPRGIREAAPPPRRRPWKRHYDSRPSS